MDHNFNLKKKSLFFCYKIPIILLFIIFIFPSCKSKNEGFTIKEGILDLTDFNLDSSEPIALSGDWKFLWNEFVQPDSIPTNIHRFKNVKIPHRFQDVIWEKNQLSNQGYATYYLKIFLNDSSPDLGLYIGVENTAYVLYVNGKYALSQGIVGVNQQSSIPKYHPTTYQISENTKQLELVFHISNYHNRYGGLRNSPLLGRYDKIKKNRELGIAFDMMVFGGLLLTGIYQLFLFVLRRKDLSTLYLGIFCIFYAIKTTFENERIFLVLVSDFPWEYDLKISYIATFAGPYLLLSYLYSQFPDLVSKTIQRLTLGVFVALTGIVFFSQAIFYSMLASYHQIYIIILGIYGFYILVISIREKKESAKVLMFGYTLFFIIAGVNDILYSQGIINSIYLSNYALMIFVLTQGIAIAIRFSNSFRREELISNQLKGTIHSFSKFVPQESLKLLGKSDIQSIEIGDQVSKTLTILFSDIRSFTVLSEKMTPKETFNFINSYLSRMNPVIEKNNGFIDKFIGDAIMAIFDSPEDAIIASLEMIDEINIYNLHRENMGYDPIKIGIGLNTGNVIMGTVGNYKRMNTTVIGDSVNLASRIESLTKIYKSDILISDFTYKALSIDNKYEFREIDIINVKGKSIPVSLYECFNHDPIEIRKKKRESHSFIMTGLSLKNAGELDLATKEFYKALRIYPQDNVAKIQIKKILKEKKLNIT